MIIIGTFPVFSFVFIPRRKQRDVVLTLYDRPFFCPSVLPPVRAGEYFQCHWTEFRETLYICTISHSAEQVSFCCCCCRCCCCFHMMQNDRLGAILSYAVEYIFDVMSLILKTSFFLLNLSYLSTTIRKCRKKV